MQITKGNHIDPRFRLCTKPAQLDLIQTQVDLGLHTMLLPYEYRFDILT